MSIEDLAMPFAGGASAGVLFFGGLWWTIRRGLQSAHPELWFLPSLIVRMGLATSAFLWLSHGQWPRLVACLTGFISARCWLLRALPAIPVRCPVPLHGGTSCD